MEPLYMSPYRTDIYNSGGAYGMSPYAFGGGGGYVDPYAGGEMFYGGPAGYPQDFMFGPTNQLYRENEYLRGELNSERVGDGFRNVGQVAGGVLGAGLGAATFFIPFIGPFIAAPMAALGAGLGTKFGGDLGNWFGEGQAVVADVRSDGRYNGI